jgi:hypothetical protein
MMALNHGFEAQRVVSSDDNERRAYDRIIV